VTDLLQHTSIPDVSGILVSVAILWGIWPVACGIIGAMRGQALQGAMHGLFWGPLGILIVLLSSPKYECPVCGKKTLNRPYEEICPPPPMVPGMARKVLTLNTPAPIHDDPTHAPQADQVMSVETNIPIPAPAADKHDDEEAEKLRAWVNAD